MYRPELDSHFPYARTLLQSFPGFALVRAFGTAVELPAFLRFMRYMASEEDEEGTET